ncbi:MAG: hypothetical protein GYB68_13205 [Chloroflexi bacterium]|nr:hypothetical protein [Chloroflexota bacterium]
MTPPPDVYNLIKTKRAVRRFSQQPISDDIARTILNAGRLSGSAKNTQPWHFVAIRQHDTLQALSQCGAYASHLAGAAMAVALVTEDPFERLTVPFDLGRATQNMMLTAWSHGIGSVMATIYQSAKAAAIIKAPASYALPWCVSFGYPAEPRSGPPRRGGRRPADDVIHWESW